MTSKFNEDSLEKSIISLFEDKGYEYITGRDITKNYEEVLLVDDLKEFIRNKYNNKI